MKAEPDDCIAITCECPECGEENEFLPWHDRICTNCNYGSEDREPTNEDEQCASCDSISGVYYSLCDNCMTQFNRLRAQTAPAGKTKDEGLWRKAFLLRIRIGDDAKAAGRFADNALREYEYRFSK